METLNAAFHRIRLLKEEADKNNLELRLVPFLSRRFSPDLVVSVERNPTQIQVQISLSSLYGFNGILPDYFTDEILREPQCGLRGFLDIFAHRQLMLLYEIWAKYQFFYENTLDAERERNQQLDQMILSIGGLTSEDNPNQPLFVRGLKRCLVGLFQRRIKSPSGFKFLLKTYFGNLDIQLDQHLASVKRIPSNQQTRLGGNCHCLGREGSFLAGSKMRDTDGSFGLVLKSLNLEDFYQFLPDGESYSELFDLFLAYTGEEWDCYVRLELKAEEVPDWKLGAMRLGADTWAKSEDLYEDAGVDIGKLQAVKS